jgi:mevalonate kinase
MSIREKSPTKIILIGEHSVVYGKLALVCAINMYCHCEVKLFNGEMIIVEDKENNYRGEYNIKEILKLGDNFKRNNKRDKFFKIILNVVLKYLKIKDVQPIVIEIEKEAPLGGCGVSTSVIVSMAKALSKYFKKELSKEDLFKIAMEVETKFHGYKSSGLDQIAIIYGGLIKYRKKKEGFDYEKLEIESDILNDILIINSGNPEALTGEVVEFVKNNIKNDPARAGKIFNNLENLTYNKEEFYNIIDQAGKELIDLGIVTSKTQKLINDLNNLGGHVKVSGAGAHKGEGSGALICFGGERKKIEEHLRENGLDFYRVNVAE